eukprot:scaffold57905_cov36-Prasinocladus_malaysianus.AAC.1
MPDYTMAAIVVIHHTLPAQDVQCQRQQSPPILSAEDRSPFYSASHHAAGTAHVTATAQSAV